MARRRLSGILKYGSRDMSNKTQKMQQGAQFAAVGSAYDWRQDEYEVALMRQKIRNEDATLSNKYSGKGDKGRNSNSKTNANKDLASFSGGLQGAREAANLEFMGIQQKLLDSAGASGLSDLTGEQYNNVLYYHDTTDSRLKDQEALFSEAKGALSDEDMDALAISDDGAMFVSKIEGGKEVGKLAITREEYLKNIKQYRPLTIKDFSQWKQFKSTSLDINDIKMFMLSGSMGPKKLKERFIDPLKNTIKLTVKGNNVSIGGGGGTTVLSTISTFNSINNSINPSISFGPEVMARRDETRIALNNLYNDVLAGKEDKKRFENSVEAEVLKSYAVRARITEAEGIDERRAQLEEEKKKYVLNLLFELKGATVSRNSTDDDDDGGFNAGKTAGDPVITGLAQMYSSSSVGKTSFSVYDQDENSAKNKSGVSSYKAPVIEGNIPKSRLGTAYNTTAATDIQIKQSFFGVNDAVNMLSPLSKGVYTSEGIDLNEAMADNPAFLEKFAVLRQNADVDLVFLPVTVDGGKLAIREILAMQKSLGIKAKVVMAQAFLDSKARSGKKYNITAESMAKNDKGGQVMNDYAAWLYDGTKVTEYDKKYAKDPETYRFKKQEALDASHVLQSSSDTFNQMYGKRFTIAPFYRYKITVSDKFNNGVFSMAKIKDSYTDAGGSEAIFEKASSADESYMEETLKADDGLFTSYYNLDVYVQAKGAALSGKEDEKMNATVNRVNAYIEGMELVNDNNIITKRSVPNIIRTLTNKAN